MAAQEESNIRTEKNQLKSPSSEKKQLVGENIIGE